MRESAMRRLFVTLGCCAVLFGAQHAALPGVHVEMWRRLASILAQGPRDMAQISLVALGIMPALTAFLVVEVLALLVPAWRKLRGDEPEGRARLRRSALTLSLVLAAVQAWLLATWMTSVQYGYETLIDPGMANHLLVSLTIVGGYCFVLGIIFVIERWGLGNGFSIVLGLACALSLGELFAQMSRAMSDELFGPLSVLLIAAILIAVGVATWKILTVHEKLAAAKPRPLLAWRHPTSGLVPVIEASSIVAVLVQLVPSLGASRALLEPATKSVRTVELALAGIACLVFSLLFNRISPIASALRRATPDEAPAPEDELRALRKDATRRSLLFVLGVALVPFLPAALHLPLIVPVVSLIPLVAIVMDLVAEHRFRAEAGVVVVAWSMHRVALVDVALATLQRAGITAHARGAYHRALLHFFGPYVSIDLCVPEPRRLEAQEILRGLFTSPAFTSAS